MKEIILGNGGVAIVDDEDYDWLSQFRWSQTNGYVQTSVNRKGTLMHRMLMNAQKGQEIDHINRVRHDNRRENLRFCTRSENMRNSTGSGFKRIYDLPPGVTYHKRSGRYYAQVRTKNANHFLGSFGTPEEAHDAYLTRTVCKLIRSFDVG